MEQQKLKIKKNKKIRKVRKKHQKANKKFKGVYLPFIMMK